MNLKQKVLKLFNVYIPEGMSDKEIIKDLNRRGKFDIKKIHEILFMLVEEVEKLTEDFELLKTVKPKIKKK